MSSHGSRFGRRTLIAPACAILLGGSSLACAAKVNQDVYDQDMAALRGEYAEMDARISDQDARLAAAEASLAALRDDLVALEDELMARVTELEDGIRFAMPVHFEFDRADVRADDRPALNRFASVLMRHYTGATVTVEGFADPAGSEAYNQKLSESRAEAVADYLADNWGIERSELRTVGYGEERLVVPGAQGPGRAGMENRRVSFVIEYGGPPAGEVETVATLP